MTRTRIVALAGLCALAGGAGCSQAPAAEEPAAKGAGERDFIQYDIKHAPLDFVKIGTVDESDGATSTTLPGRVIFDEDHTQHVASPIDGRAVRILVRPGDKVRAGQPLVELSSPVVGQLQSDAQKSQLDLALSTQAMERVRKLQADGAVAEKEVAQTEGDYRKARSDGTRAATQLRALGIASGDPAVTAALHAQIAGTVVERNVLPGHEVRGDQSAPLVTISNLDTVWVLADAYEADLGSIQVGDAVAVRVAAYPDQVFTGKVGHIGDVIDPTTHTAKIRCVVPNADHRLKPEMFARVDVKGGAGGKTLLIPSQAVYNEGDRSLVIVATEGNVFRSRPVEVGPDIGGQVRVFKGLNRGEKIVSQGAIFMRREIESQ